MNGVLFVIWTVVSSLAAAEIENEDDTLNRLSITEKLVQDLLHEVKTLKVQDKHRDKKVSHLEKQLRLQRKQNSNLKSIVNKLELSDRESDLGASSNRMRRQEAERPIAFFAKMVAHLEHASVHQNVIFDAIVTNLGNAYNNTNGVFIAPARGTYVFSTTLVSLNFSSDHAQFVVNGNAITNMYVSAGSISTGDDTTSQTIVLLLQKGDSVSVQNLDSDRGFYGLSHSIFSGFLLQEDFSSSAIIG